MRTINGLIEKYTNLIDYLDGIKANYGIGDGNDTLTVLQADEVTVEADAAVESWNEGLPTRPAR